MKGTIVTGSLIVFSDGFVWKRLSNEKAYKIWVSAENEDFELYKVRVDDESESLIESLEDLQDALKQGHYVCIAREIVDDYNGLPYKYECSNGTLWDYCIHFEGNEHLLGTNKNG